MMDCLAKFKAAKQTSKDMYMTVCIQAQLSMRVRSEGEHAGRCKHFQLGRKMSAHENVAKEGIHAGTSQDIGNPEGNQKYQPGHSLSPQNHLVQKAFKSKTFQSPRMPGYPEYCLGSPSPEFFCQNDKKLGALAVTDPSVSVKAHSGNRPCYC